MLESTPQLIPTSYLIVPHDVVRTHVNLTTYIVALVAFVLGLDLDPTSYFDLSSRRQIFTSEL